MITQISAERNRADNISQPTHHNTESHTPPVEDTGASCVSSTNSIGTTLITTGPAVAEQRAVVEQSPSATILEWLKVLVPENAVVELRTTPAEISYERGDRPLWGFFAYDQLPEMAVYAVKLADSCQCVEFTLNPVRHDCLSRRAGRIGNGAGAAVDQDVLKRRWLLIDIDPVRKRTISSTNEEKSAAWDTVQQVKSHLEIQKWPTPIVADSGNGYHLLYRIELPSEDGDLVRNVLRALATRFNNDKAKVDTSVCKPSQLCKLYGTKARKGSDTSKRPHRWTRVIEIPTEREVVAKSLLEQLASEVAASAGIVLEEFSQSCEPECPDEEFLQKQRKANAEDDPEGLREYVRSESVQRFGGIDGTTPKVTDDPHTWGIVDREAERGSGALLCNFTVRWDTDVQVLDDQEMRRRFEGHIHILGREVPFAISGTDFASNEKLRAAIITAAGSEAQIRCGMDLLRRAISAINQGKVVQRKTTTDFGWDSQGIEYLVPDGRITKEGFLASAGNSEIRVDLTEEELACKLRLNATASDLQKVKKHIVDDLLNAHDQRVTYSLLGTVAAAPLYRFAGDIGRFSLWLTGLTGTGKSYMAKIFMNFFGDFPVASGRFATWASTANYVQRQGYFFKDALYLVDDYKPEVIPAYQVVRILQNYADGTGRGRLKIDATTNTTRSIRGLLVSTGEDIPEHSASAMARSIIISVPQQEKNLARGQRCARECKNYSAVTVDFLRWFLAHGRSEGFSRRVANLQRYYYRGIAGEQNDARIASNFSLLAAGFLEMARFLGDVWPGWKAAARQFVTKDLNAIRDQMVGQVKGEQASEVFLKTLTELIRFERVRFQRDTYSREIQYQAKVIGKVVELRGSGRRIYQISTSFSLEAVQESLRLQNKPQLRLSERTLLDQLLQDGKLVDQEGNPLSGPESEDVTTQRRLENTRTRCFNIDAALFDDEDDQPKREKRFPDETLKFISSARAGIEAQAGQMRTIEMGEEIG